MKIREEFDVYTCDGCEKEVAVRIGDELPLGWHLNVTHIHGAGGDGGVVYACSDRCIKKAVLNYRTENNGY
jgi:hypothetical protein